LTREIRARSREARDDGVVYRQRLFESAALEVELREVRYEVGWEGIEDSYRARRLPFMNEQQRATLDSILLEARAPQRRAQVHAPGVAPDRAQNGAPIGPGLEPLGNCVDLIGGRTRIWIWDRLHINKWFLH
jgi:hypothetical protein